MSSKNQGDIERVLAGEKSYDDLDERDQAIVRVSWAEQVAERRAHLDYAAEFTLAGRSWTGANEQGTVVVRGRNTPWWHPTSSPDNATTRHRADSRSPSWSTTAAIPKAKRLAFGMAVWRPRVQDMPMECIETVWQLDPTRASFACQ